MVLGSRNADTSSLQATHDGNKGKHTRKLFARRGNRKQDVHEKVFGKQDIKQMLFEEKQKGKLTLNREYYDFIST